MGRSFPGSQPTQTEVCAASVSVIYCCFERSPETSTREFNSLHTKLGLGQLSVCPKITNSTVQPLNRSSLVSVLRLLPRAADLVYRSIYYQRRRVRLRFRYTLSTHDQLITQEQITGRLHFAVNEIVDNFWLLGKHPARFAGLLYERL